MESPRGAGRRRHLLPFEVELCEFVGIDEDEYFYFQDLTDRYNGKRPKGYERIPDVRNDPVSVIVSLVIGAALSAVGALLAPKPKAPEAQQQQAPTLKTADVTGAKRFTATTAFDSLQELAALGDVIPLVFANRDEATGVGGIRVKSQLLWSQLLSLQVAQELRVVLLLSISKLASDPDFQGYAIGDQTLRNYTNAKIGLSRRLDGGRLTAADQYPEGTIAAWPVDDIFTVYSDTSQQYMPWFSGTRTPSTQTQFGCFSPLVNATPYRPTYELVLIGYDSDDKIKQDGFEKRKKLKREYATRASLISATSTTCTYRITGGQQTNGFSPWGVDDIRNAVEDRRIVADDSIQVGSLYMAGTAQVVCTNINSDDVWALNAEKDFTFTIQEAGEIDVYADSTAVISKGDGVYKTPNRSYGLILQRLAVGTVANNRECDITEIGVKSTVWKQVNGFPNVNSQPDAATIQYYESENGSIQLGNVNRYHKRISFFRLYVRPLGAADTAWTELTAGTLFAVEGNTPQSRYNFVRILHTKGQYEFRFVPYPGGAVQKNWMGQSVYFLGGTQLANFSASGYTVAFNGYQKVLSIGVVSNGDWIVGASNTDFSGAVKGFLPSSVNGSKPLQTVTSQEVKYLVSSTGNYGNDYYFYSVTTGPGKTVDTVRWGTTIYQKVYYTNPFTGAVVVESNNIPPNFKKGAYKANPDGTLYHEVIKETYTTTPKNPTGSAVVTPTGGSGTGLSVKVKQWENGYIEFSVNAPGQDYVWHETVGVAAFGGTYQLQLITDEKIFTSNNLNPYDAIADIGLYDAERMSHMDNPEHEIVYVNEQVIQNAPQYPDLSIVGLRLNSSKEWSSFSQLSAYIQEGVEIERLIDDNGNPTTTLLGPSNNFAEIAYALLTDSKLGAGELIGASGVSRSRMTLAAQFCRASGFTWDGVLAAPQNLRSWIFENAAYNLLDFTVLGGQFSLVPSVTYNSSFQMDGSVPVQIKALFTDGNISNLQVTWRTPEERQLFKAVVRYRQEKLNGFAEERLFSVRFSDAQGGSDNDPEEEFDLTNFCTQAAHAQTFARYALALRKLVDHSVQFETTPASAVNLEPGQHLRLVSEATHTSRFNNGAINTDGLIISTSTLADGSHDVLYWEPGTVGVQTGVLVVAGGICQTDAIKGKVFTLANTTTTSRVYKVETLELSDEGFVVITASYEPVTAAMGLATLSFTDSDFVLELA